MNSQSPARKKFGPIRPVLDEARLKEMYALAADVYRGVKQPKIQCAEDVLYLVGEVRRLRLELAKKQDPSMEKDFADKFADMFSEFKDPTLPEARARAAKMREERELSLFTKFKRFFNL